MAYDGDYVEEYTEVYEKLVASSLESFGDGKDGYIEQLFKMIDDAVDDGDIEKADAISIKKNAYMQLISTVLPNCQKMAITVMDKKYKFGLEIEQQEHQANILGENSRKAKDDADYVEAQIQALNQQVVDNRRIKALDTLGETYGTAMAGGLKVTQAMWETYFGLVSNLANNSDDDVSNPGDDTDVVPA